MLNNPASQLQIERNAEEGLRYHRFGFLDTQHWPEIVEWLESSPSIESQIAAMAYSLRDYCTTYTPDYWFIDPDEPDVPEEDQPDYQDCRSQWEWAYSTCIEVINSPEVIDTINRVYGHGGIEALAKFNRSLKSYQGETKESWGPDCHTAFSEEILRQLEDELSFWAEWLYVLSNRIKAPRLDNEDSIEQRLKSDSITSRLYKILKPRFGHSVSFDDLYGAWDDIPTDTAIVGRLKALREKMEDHRYSIQISTKNRTATLI